MTETKSDVGWRITLGLLAAAARLTPVPFLDDVLRTRAFHLLVSRTLRAHGRTYGSVVVAPLYSDSEGCLSGCFTSLLFLPIKLLLFPIRKIFNWVMLAKHLARDLSEALGEHHPVEDLANRKEQELDREKEQAGEASRQ
ncbi:MAG: hypothetical protein K8H88_11695, partial [Sandaracinaceae bacterium]|nr:hypothetical protein [Sandaracinaceae bacterium]